MLWFELVFKEMKSSASFLQQGSYRDQICLSQIPVQLLGNLVITFLFYRLHKLILNRKI